MKVNGTGSLCMLEEYVKDNYYAKFHKAITAAVKCTVGSRLEVNFDKVSGA